MEYHNLSNEVYCIACHKWIGMSEIYLPDGSENEGRINHLKCDTTVGYTWDAEWLRMIEGNCGNILD